MTNLEVSLGRSEIGVAVCTFHGPRALLAKVLAVSTILFGERKKGLDSLLVCKMVKLIILERRSHRLQSEWLWISTIIFFSRKIV